MINATLFPLRKHLVPGLMLLIVISLGACKPAEDVYIYEVNEVEVKQQAADKQNLKSDLEFLSLAYSDLFGEPIPNNVLNQMLQAYQSLGDKALIADVLIRNMLNEPGAAVPADVEMRADVGAFVEQTYLLFYVRQPNDYERWYFEELIGSQADITPEMVYYAFLTSDEYRFF